MVVSQFIYLRSLLGYLLFLTSVCCFSSCSSTQSKKEASQKKSDQKRQVKNIEKEKLEQEKKIRKQNLKDINDRSFTMRWSRNFDPPHETGNFPITSAHPVIESDRLYVGDLQGVMRSFNVSDGQPGDEWQVEGAILSAPLITEKMMFFGTQQGFFYGIDLESKTVKFSVDLEVSVNSVPTYHQGRLFVQLRNHSIVALDATTGKLLWSYRRSVPFLTSLHRSGSPLIFSDSIIVGFSDGYVVAIRRDDGLVKWENQISSGGKFVDVDVPLIMIGGQLWAAAHLSYLKVLDPRSGDELKTIPVQISSNIIYQPQKGVVYAGTSDGHLVEITVSDGIIAKNIPVPSRLSLLSQTQTQISSGVAALAVMDEKIVIGTFEGRIFTIEQDRLDETDAFSQVFEFGHKKSSLFSFMSSSQSYLAVLSSRNRLYVFRKI